MTTQLTAPVALFVFRRPQRTKMVAQEIINASPPEVYIVADGPHINNSQEAQACKETRDVIDQLDWPCKVHKNYSGKNMGLKERFVTGLDWIFNSTDRAIILEDDCLPAQDFFTFVDTLLEYYSHNPRVWDISGTNHLKVWKEDEQDYHFSNYGGIWGWGTWRDSYENFDPDMTAWGSTKAKLALRKMVSSSDERYYLNRVYEMVDRGKIETWDYPWGFSRQLNHGVSAVPAKNLVRNVGFDQTATNTTDSQLKSIERHTVDFPLSHPDEITIDKSFDAKYHQLRTPFWMRSSILRYGVDQILKLPLIEELVRSR